MLDKIKLSGNVDNINPQGACKIANSKRDKLNRQYIPILIPNRDKTEFLIFKYYERPYECIIEGNLRRWWFGIKSLNDLDYIDFKNALSLITKRLGIAESILYDFEVKKIELGANIKLPSSSAPIIQMFMSYPKLQRKSYEKGSVYFTGKKYAIIFYDKLLEMKDNGILKNKIYEKVSKQIFILRIEKKIWAKSGVSFGGKIKTLRDVSENWGFLADDWLDILHKVKFVDLFDNTKNFKLKSLTPKENLEFLAYSFMNLHGLERCLDLSKIYLKNRKSETVNRLINIFNKFRSNEKRVFFTETYNTAVKKYNSLKFGVPRNRKVYPHLDNIESIDTKTNS